MKKIKKEEEKFQKLLGKRIEAFRKVKEMSQTDLAKKIGTQHPQIGRLERGETNATIIALMRISKALGVELKELVDF